MSTKKDKYLKSKNAKVGETCKCPSCNTEFIKEHYHLYYDVFNSLYIITLLGGEFSNCHGQGSTEGDAVISLKIRINQLRNKKLLCN